MTEAELWLVREDAGGGRSEVGLRRPPAWWSANEVSEVGDRVELDMPELGVSGTFQVVSMCAAQTRLVA